MCRRSDAKIDTHTISIFVDADACPVKKEILQTGKEKNIPVRFIASYDHKPANMEGEWTFVDPGKEAADLHIMNRIRKGDVLITQDIGLASLVLPKGVYALSPKGTEYREETIDVSLGFRYLAAQERKKGNYGKGPKPFTEADRRNFLVSLLSLLSKIEGV